MIDHIVSFTATSKGLVADCECGWRRQWMPWRHISEVDYAEIFAIGLDHARESEPLPEAPGHLK